MIGLQELTPSVIAVVIVIIVLVLCFFLKFRPPPQRLLDAPQVNLSLEGTREDTLSF